MALSTTLTNVLLSTPLAQKRSKVIRWFILKGAVSPKDCITLCLTDLPMQEEYRTTLWGLIDRKVINETIQGSQYYLNVDSLNLAIRKREWFLLDLAAAITLISAIWLGYLLIPILPFFN